MPQKSDAELTTEAQVIRDETTALANTKTRVYDILKNIIDSKPNNTAVGGGAWGTITGVLADQTDLDSALDAIASTIANHIADTAAAHAASAVAFTPVGTIAATDVQAAIAEVASEAAGTVPSASESTEGKAELATQAENNTGTDDARIVTPLKINKLDRTAVVLTDASTMDLTDAKHTLASSSATRTFTISHTGEFITIEVTLSATTAVYTFPATALCTSEGAASGNNTLALNGVSGDKYIIVSQKIGSNYYVVSKNFGQ